MQRTQMDDGGEQLDRVSRAQISYQCNSIIAAGRVC